MDITQTYLSVLVDTLQKKKDVLEIISNLTEQQKQILQNDNFEEEEFQKTIDQKEKYLKELEKLDSGFEQVYERVALVLKHNKEMYQEKIQIAQQLIREVMDLSVGIRALEEQNKERFFYCLLNKRGKIKSFKTGNKVAINYYKNMPNMHQVGQSYFLDKKK